MTVLVLRWRVPDPPVKLRWRGPLGMAAQIARDPAAPIAAIVGPPGPPGPTGPAANPTRFDITSPAGTWTIAHGLGHVPLCDIYDPGGNRLITDITADAVHIVAMFAAPTAGFVLAF